MAPRLQEVRPGLAQADTEDGDVAAAQLLYGLIEGVPGKGVHTAGEEQNGFLALYILEPLVGFEDGVEYVGFAKTREIEMVNGIAHFVFVLREVHFEASF